MRLLKTSSIKSVGTVFGVFVCLFFVIPCRGGTITVCWDGSGDYLTIQAAIDAASDGDEVVVCDGVFTGTDNRDIDFKGKAITVRSENGPENCIIDCNGTASEPHRGFYFHNGEDRSSILRGFTVTNGYASDLGGGGICCDHSSPTITECKILNNSGYAGCDGGGICCWYSSPTITRCIVAKNMISGSYDFGGGICCSHESHAVITNCTIAGNKGGFGGGIYIGNNSNPRITNCVITGNQGVDYGGGIEQGTNDCNTIIANCTITGNWGDSYGGGVSLADGASISHSIICGNLLYRYGGAGMWCIYSVTVTNCLICGNSTSRPNYGGGIYWYPDSGDLPPITNCTISRNSTSKGGGFYLSRGNNQAMNNCIIWDNSASEGNELFVGESSTLTMRFCDVQRDSGSVQIGPGATIEWIPGNIEANPLFVGGTVGTWTANGQYDPCNYQVTLFDHAANWGENELRGKFVELYWLGWLTNLQFMIVSNSINTVTIWADWNTINTGVSWVTSGANYKIYDYHLQSEAGRWDTSEYAEVDLAADGFINLLDFAAFAGFWCLEGESIPADFDNNGVVDFSDLVIISDNYLSYIRGAWVNDGVTSRCIDAGNPSSPLCDEPLETNNIRINMGAYGGTAEASMPPYDWALLANLTNDGKVDSNDLEVFVNYWLDSGICIPSDLNRSQSVDMLDFALLAQDWFLETSWYTP